VIRRVSDENNVLPRRREPEVLVFGRASEAPSVGGAEWMVESKPIT
jgi:hypothetical protein